MSDEIANIAGLSGEMLVALGENDIKSLDDLADLANDELLDIVGKANLTEDLASEIIMSARAHWFEDEGEVKSDGPHPEAKIIADGDPDDIKSEKLIS